MRVVVDMQGLQTPASANRGVGRYVGNVVRGLALTAGSHELWLAFNGAFPDSIALAREELVGLIPPERLVAWDVPSAAGSKDVEIAAEIVREGFLNAFDPDIIFCPNLQEGRADAAVTSVGHLATAALTCSTLHDLTPLHYRERYLSDPGQREWYLAKLEHARRSDLILTVSNHVAAEIAAELGVDPARVRAIHNAHDPAIFNAEPLTAEERAVPGSYGIEGDYLFYVGGADAHKNLERLIAAYAALEPALRGQVRLVLGGREVATSAAVGRAIDARDVAGQVLTPGFIAEADLAPLLKGARGFVFPSTHEGFGLPLLEAMACGTPAIASGSTSMAEIASEDALFDPLSTDAIRARLERLLTDRDYARDLARTGLERASHFSWQRTAATMWRVWEEALTTAKRPGSVADDPLERTIQAIAACRPQLGVEERIDLARALGRTFVFADDRPRLYLDISSVIQNDDRSGIQRVTRAISGELLKRTDLGDVRLVYARPGDRMFHLANRYMRETFGLDVPALDRPVVLRPGDTLLFLDLHPGVAIAQAAENVWRRSKGVRVYHVVYDILPALQPQAFWPELCEEFTRWLRAVSRSDGAICISRSVADELAAYLTDTAPPRATPFPIGYFHLGADIESSAPTTGLPADSDRQLADLGDRPTFLTVGTLEPRKGHRLTLAAFERLWQAGQDVNLAIVGRLGWGMEDLRDVLPSHPELGRRLFWFQGISDEYLEAVYERASCLLAASEAEGFGLPLIEAARRGVPILARDIPVFREVAGDHAAYFKPGAGATELADAIAAWLADDRGGRAPASSGMPWLTWGQSAEQLRTVFADGHWYRSIVPVGALAPGVTYGAVGGELEWRGFHLPESTADGAFRWTARRDAEIGFAWTGAGTGRSLHLRATTLGEQSLTLAFNGVELLRGDFRLKAGELVAELPELKRGMNTIGFALPTARMPNASDQRLLALAIHDLRIS